MNQSNSRSDAVQAKSQQSNVERLQLQALEERNHLHQSVAELKAQVAEVRHDLDPATNVRKHFAAAAIAASGICFLFGYGFGGLFTRS
jgi:chorismate mutase